MEKAYVSNRIMKNYFLYHINGQLYNHIILLFFLIQINMFTKIKLKLKLKHTHTKKKKKSQQPNYVSTRNILIYPINKKRKRKKRNQT